TAMATSNQIRQQFLDFFAQRQHRVVASSPLIPANDPTLLFTNAGMVQFKDVFLGGDKRSYSRAASSQRCVRAGGKHNDLDQVGYTARHHTFFEMLGNFSFGDYFKQDAIQFAWDYLTDVAGLPADRLWITVYETDDEAYQLWTSTIGVPADRVVRIGDKPGARQFESDNFWAMGDTGPCGPCTEIFYDHGPEVEGGPPGTPEEDGDRYIEVWNLVFMQFDRDAAGNLNPLPKPCVDTGMGLERLAAILQGVHSNYEIDIFQHLIRRAGELTGAEDLSDDSLKVISDHIRACAFLIVDGVLPSNEGRGYVLRRIIRRAIRHGYKLGQKGLFFHQMVEALVDEMGDAYPELRQKADFVDRVLQTEEKKFAATLDQGMRLLEGSLEELEDGEIPGESVFRLYDTYGFPADLTADIARERGLKVDMAGFQTEMEAQRARARAASQFKEGEQIDADVIAGLEPTEFLGYQHLTGVSAAVLAILTESGSAETLQPGQTATIILNQTPFYAESGGQVGDTGQLTAGDAVFQVTDTQKVAGVFHGHAGTLAAGELSVGDIITADVDAARRGAIILNHSGTHLLHAALREVLGDHVEQKGSLVAPDRLRFDFSHFQPVTPDELRRIEQLVNREIRANAGADAAVMGYDDAIDAGAMALFGEKYGDEVRVIRFGKFSVELCGGTHVDRVGDIGLLKVMSETGIASGVRRIEAVTGAGALDWIDDHQSRLAGIAEAVKSSVNDADTKVRQLVDRNRELEKELSSLRSKMASSSSDDLVDQASEIDGIKVVAAKIDGVNVGELRDMLDKLKDKLQSAAVVLGTVNNGKVQLVAGVTKAETGRIKAGELVNSVAEKVGGRGGGRPDMAQAGGDQPDQLDSALSGVADWVQQKLAG
ncbi:MAG: alanine--tRNA ligase, partial [Xanthomonadales bacterium]|nr:alanine--tRNA ligase [Xanthomonadales bacterium]